MNPSATLKAGTHEHKCVKRACLVLCAWCLVLAGPVRAQKPAEADCDAKRAEARRVLRQAAALIPSAQDSTPAYKMSSIVLWQARAGDAEAARENAHRIEDESQKRSARYFVATGLAEAGQAELARKAAREVDEDQFDMSMTMIADSLAERGDFETAVEAAREVRSIGQRAQYLCFVALAQGKAGKTTEAISTLTQVKGLADLLAGDERRLALQCLAYGQVRLGSLHEAENTAELFESNFIRASVLRDLGEAFAEKGERKQAMAVFERAIEAARNAETNWWELVPDGPLRGIPGALARAGYTDKALEAARSLKAGREQAEALAQIVVALADDGQVKQAEKVAAEIEKKFGQGAPWEGAEPGSYGAQNLPYTVALTHYDDIGPWRAVAEAWAKKGNFKQALSIAERIEWRKERVLALRTIATEQARAGKTDAARDTLQGAVQFLGRQEQDYDWLTLLTQVAADQRRVGDVEGARKSFSTALDFASTVKEHVVSGMDRVGHLTQVAKMQAEAGDWEEARRTLEMYRSEQHYFLISLEETASLRAKAGDVAGVLAWVEHEKDPLAKAVGLLGVGSGILEGTQTAGCK